MAVAKAPAGKKRNGRTSMANNHSHSYKVDAKGNGDTSRDDKHVHQVLNYSVQMANGHSHRLM